MPCDNTIVQHPCTMWHCLWHNEEWNWTSWSLVLHPTLDSTHNYLAVHILPPFPIETHRFIRLSLPIWSTPKFQQNIHNLINSTLLSPPLPLSWSISKHICVHPLMHRRIQTHAIDVINTHTHTHVQHKIYAIVHIHTTSCSCTFTHMTQVYGRKNTHQLKHHTYTHHVHVHRFGHMNSPTHKLKHHMYTNLDTWIP